MKPLCRPKFINKEWTITFPDGKQIPGITSVSISSEVGELVTATITLYLDPPDEAEKLITQ